VVEGDRQGFAAGGWRSDGGGGSWVVMVVVEQIQWNWDVVTEFNKNNRSKRVVVAELRDVKWSSQ